MILKKIFYLSKIQEIINPIKVRKKVLQLLTMMMKIILIRLIGEIQLKKV